MPRMSKRSPKRGLEQQLEELNELRLRPGPMLDIRSRDGLAIDDYVKDYGKGDKPYLRAAVERIGRDLLADSFWSYSLPSDTRKLAKRALNAVLKVNQSHEARWLRSLGEHDHFMMSMAFGSTEGSGYGGQEVSEIVDALKVIDERCESVETNFKLAEPLKTGRSELLAGLFVQHMRTFHEQQIGDQAPKSKSGRFVRFMQAAWYDLKFPPIPEDTLGFMAERLPYSPQNLS